MMTLPAFLIAYLLGSIPFGLLLTRAAGMGDIRLQGSGNIGATNVMRTGHKKLAIATLLLDAGKGIAGVMAARALGLEGDMLYIAAFLCVLGHVFPVWLRFKGGKGVATALGVTFTILPLAGVLFCVTWLIVFFLTRYVSLASIEAIWCASIAALVTGSASGLIFFISLAVLITYTHRSNLARLRAGTESKFARKKP